MYGSPCRLPKDVCGRPGAMRKPACVSEGEKKATPSSTKHRALVWCQNWKPYGILACGDVQCFRNQVDHTKRSAKVFSRTALSSAGYLGVTCNELRVQRCSAKGFGRTVQLNPLASRETSDAVEAKHVLCFLMLVRFGKIARRATPLSCHVCRRQILPPE